MKKRIKGLITLWLAIIVMCSAFTIPAFAYDITSAYYYTGTHSIESGAEIWDENFYNNIIDFQYGENAQTIIAQGGTATEGQIGWKVWGADTTSGGIYVNDFFFAKKLNASITAQDYESITSWHTLFLFEKIFMKTVASNLTITVADNTADDVIYGATLQVSAGYSLPDFIYVYSDGEILTEGKDYTYDPSTGAVNIKVNAVIGDILLIAEGRTNKIEFQMGGTDNKTLQWRYVGETNWKDIAQINGATATTIDINANGNLVVNNTDTGVKVNYAQDISKINENITAMQNALANKADASALSEAVIKLNAAISDINTTKTNLENLKTTLATNVSTLTASINNIDEAYKAADKVLEEALKALTTRVDAIEELLKKGGDSTENVTKEDLVNLKSELEGNAENNTAEIVSGVVSGLAFVGSGVSIALIIIERKKRLIP